MSSQCLFKNLAANTIDEEKVNCQSKLVFQVFSLYLYCL